MKNSELVTFINDIATRITMLDTKLIATQVFNISQKKEIIKAIICVNGCLSLNLSNLKLIVDNIMHLRTLLSRSFNDDDVNDLVIIIIPDLVKKIMTTIKRKKMINRKEKNYEIYNRIP